MAKNNSPEQVYEVQEIVVADYAKQRQDDVDELLKGNVEKPENTKANAIRNIASGMQAKINKLVLAGYSQETAKNYLTWETKSIETGAIRGID